MAFRLAPAPHRWNLSPRAAIAVQRRLAFQVIRESTATSYRWVAGLDAAFSEDGRVCLAAAVLWDREGDELVDCQRVTRPVRFPYVPGLLSFREAPALLAALCRLGRRPDALICDGQGIAHPRRFGIASHIGLLADLPSVGCAKSILVGKHEELGPRRGLTAALVDRGEMIGEALRTRDGVRPVFVSIGHRIDLGTARGLVLACATRFRLPEPTRLADREVARMKRGEVT